MASDRVRRARLSHVVESVSCHEAAKRLEEAASIRKLTSARLPAPRITVIVIAVIVQEVVNPRGFDLDYRHSRKV